MEPVPEDVGMMESAWRDGSSSDVNLKISIIAMAVAILLLFAKLYHYLKHRNDPPPQPPPEPEVPRPKVKRTPEIIKQMLILKNVLWVISERKGSDQTEQWEQSSEDDNDNQSSDYGNQSDTTSNNSGEGRTAVSLRRAKSNLVLFASQSDGAKDEDDDHDHGSNDNLCAICLGVYENGDQICWSNNQRCSHHFHAACGIAWLAKHEECPICRAEYLVEPSSAPSESETTTAAPEENDIEQGGG